MGMSAALVIEPQTFARDLFISELNAVAYCSVRSAETLEQGVRIMKEVHCGVVFVTIDQISAPAAEIVKRLYDRADELVIKRPEVFILYTKELPVAEVNTCRNMEAFCLPRDLTRFVCYEARAAFSRLVTRKHPITLRIAFRCGHHFVYFGMCPTHLELGAQLAKLLAALAAYRSCTVEFLADLLGVTRATIKKYFHALRVVFLAAQKNANLPEPYTDVISMTRQSGGTICGVNANCVFV